MDTASPDRIARPFSILAALLGAMPLPALLPPPVSASPAPARPNIRFPLADDHRADAIGAHGNPHIDTPHLEQLAQAGFSFRGAYVMGAHHGAVCAPRLAPQITGPPSR